MRFLLSFFQIQIILNIVKNYTLLGSSVGVTVTFSLTSTTNTGNVDVNELCVFLYIYEKPHYQEVRVEMSAK